MADLKTDYKDDVLDTTQNTKRKYQMIDNGDGTVSFEDVTEYIQQGDSFGADDINDTNEEVNIINDNLNKHTISNNNRVTLAYNTDYTTLTDGYICIKSSVGAGKYVNAYIDQVAVALCSSTAGAGTIFTLFCRKGSIIKYSGSADADTGGFFYPLA